MLDALAPPISLYPRLVSARRQWIMGLAVLGVGLLLQLAPLLATERQGTHFPRVLVWLIEMPALVLLLSLGYDWAHRRRVSATRTVLASLLGALLLGALSSWLGWSIVAHTWGPSALPGPPGRPFKELTVVLFGGITGLFHCGLWAFAFVYPYTVENARLESVEADKLRLEASALRTQSELSRLRSQLEPHFLLNTLNAIAGLVTQEPKEARRLLAVLGELLSDTLKDDNESQTLGREMSWLRGYTSILESRFQGVLQVTWDIDEKANDVLVPHLFLQPLLENAVNHGALRRGAGGEVHVRATLQSSPGQKPCLRCVIEDNGPGFEPGTARDGAIGLRAVRRRLELWSSEASLTLESTAAGTRAIVELPALESP